MTPATASPRPTRSPRLLTLAQVLDELQISRSTFYDWRAKGRAPSCIKLPNGELRIRRAVLDAWIDAHQDHQEDAA